MKNANKSRFAGLETGAARRNLDEEGRGGAVLRDAEFYLRRALETELLGDHGKALNLYSAALGEDPLCIEAWTRQLWMLLYLEETPEAITWADKALQSFPNDPDILALKSLALWRNAMVEDAHSLNDAALTATRDSANVWLARGEMQSERDMRSAAACFSHAENAPGLKGLTRLRAGDILLRLDRPAEAVPFLRETTRELPQSSWAWYRYGLALRALGQREYAQPAFKRAYSLTPGDSRYKNATREKTGLFARIWNRLFARRG